MDKNPLNKLNLKHHQNKLDTFTYTICEYLSFGVN